MHINLYIFYNKMNPLNTLKSFIITCQILKTNNIYMKNQINSFNTLKSFIETIKEIKINKDIYYGSLVIASVVGFWYGDRDGNPNNRSKKY